MSNQNLNNSEQESLIKSSQPQEETQKEQVLPINKYSIYDLKSGVDTRIAEYFEELGFEEVNNHTNMKIVIGMFCLVWTALAYFNGKQFPDNYNIIAISLLFYAIGSVAYWYLEKYVIKHTFYITRNEKYCSAKLKNNKIKYIKVNSEVEDNIPTYKVWLSIVTVEGKEKECSRLNKSFGLYYDERGYCHRNIVNELTEELIQSIKKVDN